MFLIHIFQAMARALILDAAAATALPLVEFAKRSEIPLTFQSIRPGTVTLESASFKGWGLSQHGGSVFIKVQLNLSLFFDSKPVASRLS